MRQPEDRLFEKYRRHRDAKLLAKVFDRTAPALLRIARHTARRRDLADDLLQQTFLVAIERAERWDPERGFFPWMVGILVRQAKLLQRREARQPAPERLYAGTESPAADTAEARELEHAIAVAVSELGNTYRPVLHLHLFHGLNAKEIATALDRPAGSVRTQLVRGLKHLRRALPVGLAYGVTAMAPTLAAVRSVVLRHASTGAATPTAAGTGTTLMLLGGSMMKKWSLALLAIVLITLGLYPTLSTTGDDTTVSVPSLPKLPADELASQDTDNHPASQQRESAATSIALERGAIASPGASLQVRVVAGSRQHAPSLGGVWVSMHDGQMRQPRARRFGAYTDTNGKVNFDDVPTGTWYVQASIGPNGPRETARLAPGEVRDIVLRGDSVRFVKVKVVDKVGRPVPDAEVWCGIKVGGRIRPMQVNGRRAAYTDASGSARVPVDRSEFVGARKRGYAASLSSPTDKAGSEAIVLVLRDGPGRLHGEVVYEDGKPVANATVQVSITATKRQFKTAHRSEDGRATAEPLSVLERTDDRGHFEVPGLAAAAYRVWTDAMNSKNEGASVTINAHDREHIRLVVPRPAYVTGRVHRLDGTPAARLYIGVRTTTRDEFAASGVVNRDGTFTFEMPRGLVRVEVWRTFGTPLLEASVLAKATPEAITLTVDDPLTVSGRLVAEDDDPIRGWIVGALARGIEVTDETVHNAMLNGRMARSSQDGSFALYGCGEGPYTIFAQPVDTSVTGPAPVRRQDVPAGTTDLDLPVPESALGHATLRLRVVDGQGSPIEGARVQLLAGDKRRDLESVVGTFSGGRLVHGPYCLEVHAPGHAGHALRFTVDSAAVDLGDIVLERSTLLYVRPLRENKPWRGPLPRPIVHEASTGDRVEPQPTSSVIDGTLVLDGLLPGMFELRTDANDDLLGTPVPVRLLAGTATRVDWPVRIGRELTLRFAAKPRAPANARVSVTIRDKSGNSVLTRELRPKPDGASFTLQHVFSPGSYVVEAKREDGQRWRWVLDTVRWPNGRTITVPKPR